MYDIIDYKDIDENCILIDVRTEEEHEDFHIPGSICHPILNSEERKIVGTLYDRGERDLAKSKALTFGPQKLEAIHQLILKHPDKKLVFYCARGGFRSKTLSALFFTLGYNVGQLRGGIKNYRALVNENLPALLEGIELITIYGPTGSGKSDILNLIKTSYPVIDLEGFANHRGSVLGSIGIGRPYSQKMFDALLYECVKIHGACTYLIEGESKRIGRIIMPDILWKKMQGSRKLYLESPLKSRVDRLVKSYTGKASNSNLIEAISHIERRFSKDDYLSIVKSIESNEYRTAARLLCQRYYDQNYKFRPDQDTKVFTNLNDEACANEILSYVNQAH